MTIHAYPCVCVTCLHDRARAQRARQRMGHTPLYSPVVTTRDVATGATTSEAR